VSIDSRIGTQIGGYRIDRLVGRGGMGVVYLAHHLRLNRRVALKLLTPEFAEDPKFRDRFVRESQLAASLEHPNIIPIYDAGEERGLLYIAMRFVEGTDLKSVIVEHGALQPERVLPILAQTAAALDAAHARGLVHRDVKPGNILLSSEAGSLDHVYLSDFGLTKRMTSDSGMTGTGQFVGTLDYAAPEQFEGKQLDARADVYSLGGVLYECLTGEIPYRRDNQAALVYAHLMSEPPKVTDKRPELPQAIDAAVAKGMAKAPADRYESAGELVADAQDVLDARAGAEVGAAVRKEAPPAGREPAGPPPGPPGRWPRPVLVGAGALALVAVVIAAVILSSGGSGKPGRSSGAPTTSGALASGDRVVRINPTTRQAVASIPTGKGPSAVALGEGSVWVANSGDGTVSRIDPVGNKVTGVIPVGKRPVAIAFGEGSIWVANFLGNSVSRIDPATNKIVATIPLDTSPTSIAAGEGSVFVASAEQVIVTELLPVVVVWLIDPDNNTVTATSRVNGACRGLVAEGDGAAWVTTEQVVARVEPATGKILSEFTPRAAIFGITVGHGSIWVARGGLPARVLRLDAAGERVEAEIPVGNSRPAMTQSCPHIAMATGNGSVWVTNVDDGSISQIATVSNDVVDSFVVGKGLTGLVLGQGGLWVTVDAP
jgi:YVTN family beta-propeller protein